MTELRFYEREWKLIFAGVAIGFVAGSIITMFAVWAGMVLRAAL